MHEPCLSVSYNYLIASANKHDTQLLAGGIFDIIGLLMGGMGTQMSSHSRDAKLIEEMGALARAEACDHEDLAVSQIRASDAFDREFALKVQTKPADDIDLIIEHDSLIRFGTHSHNDRNQIVGSLFNEAD